MEEPPFNILLCRSIKSKADTHLQCCNKPKDNGLFCGIHSKSNNIILYGSTINNINNMNNINNDVLKTDNKKQKLNEDTEDDADKKKIYEKNELFEIILDKKKNIQLSVFSLRKSIKHCNLHKLISTKNSKKQILSDLTSIIVLERFFLNHTDKVIKAQSMIRKWLINRRKVCCNDTDILTLGSIFEIPSEYFFIFNDPKTGKKYGYDIRSLIQIIKSDYQSCPYTCRNFTQEEKDMIIKKSLVLKDNGISIELDKLDLNPEQEIEMKMKDVFHKINMLDNYTSHSWFSNLSLYHLIELYKRLEDIWNYRTGMDIESKKRIVRTGVIFNIPVFEIAYIKSKTRLQTVLLNEFDRMISEGINRDEKKLGAMLILTGLVEVSYEAADALPHLIQV
jgi:hypothetical protein